MREIYKVDRILTLVLGYMRVRLGRCIRHGTRCLMSLKY
jgi:hypothetical protein